MSSKDDTGREAEESLLYSARHGELSVVKALLEAKREGKLTLDINCKGKSRINYGWTPLHLATYFAHKEVVEVLLDSGVNVDEVNDNGDTALHKASFTGNEELVILLLNYKADVNIMNGEGQTACDVSKTHDVQRLLEAAQRAERVDKERQLLTAAKDGRVEEVQALLSGVSPPNINCVDSQGNSGLHCAAYRGQARVAVLLLQNGIDTTLRNNTGQLAIDLAKDDDMREVLSVRPVQKLQRTAARFEGPLLKKSRFLGWRPVWAVLQRGVLMYYGSRAEAARCGAGRGGGGGGAKKYLDGARLTAPPAQPALLLLHYSDGDSHRLAVDAAEPDTLACRQSWITALNEHIAYSGHYLWAGAGPETAKEATEDDDCKPLGSMQDALTTANNRLAVLETQLRECGAILSALDNTAALGNSLHHSAYMRFQHACGTGAEALSALRHCAALVAQARDRDHAKLARELERNRVLEEALAALARTHHALEMSVADEITKSKRKKKLSQTESKENFFDVYDESGDDDDDTLVTAGLSSPLGALSPWGSSPDLTRHTPIGSVDSEEDEKTATNEGKLERAVSGSSWSFRSECSRGTLVSQDGHVYRNARPYRSPATPSSDKS
ncbi:PREDICTED: oxysterol-binding protein-related protein 1-like isoform X2 [Papilio xuthus]|uniref:Oxysterol-binding protein-related protein 1-like isoform X1 n=1 Tax=Papilio xuthus TaxID=66420 RepID=A0AAJ7EHB0_PAPXU|nr:PREDICTED: oxysterol-binding protein-related protein 1-like isoform X1 [Papilio xuthus]XP_013177358.1 PREDICTED: oxysterol-binding protein-related protein 1-like isoform X2 [Papilio xuthus]